jgi:hypothetical protein
MSIFRFWFDHNKKDSFVNSLRRKRFSQLRTRILSLGDQKGQYRILDIGGDIAYWKHIGWSDPRCHISLLNLYPNEVPPEDAAHFRSVVGNALDLPFLPGEFDLVFSNSVIEHVGSYENQEKFAAEVRRISNRYIVQTPSLWFPLEPHSLIPFFQFIPHRLRALLIMRFNINYFPKAATYPDALKVSRSTMMFTKSSFRKLFPDAEIKVERLFGLPKSYTAVKW